MAQLKVAMFGSLPRCVAYGGIRPELKRKDLKGNGARGSVEKPLAVSPSLSGT